MSKQGEFLAFCKTAIEVVRPKEVNGALLNALVEAFTKTREDPSQNEETTPSPIIVHVESHDDYNHPHFNVPFVCYTIRNKVTGSMYVGRSVVGFNKRYGGKGEWWLDHHNGNLTRDLEMYGRLNFCVNIYVCQDEADMMAQEANLLRANRMLTYNIKAETDVEST
jgi:hypothetical protein